MGREFASAAARWVHLADLGVRPEIVVVCDPNPDALAWYERLDPAAAARRPTTATLLADDAVEAVYCAVPHHLHEELYVAILARGQAPARREAVRDRPGGERARSTRAIAAHPELLVRCSSELPFYPGGQAVVRWIAERPLRPRARGALAVPALERPRSAASRSTGSGAPRSTASTAAWATSACTRSTCRCAPAGRRRTSARSSPTSSPERPDGDGALVPCDTWDNAVLLCEARDGDTFPMRIETKRIAPGETNTWVDRDRRHRGLDRASRPSCRRRCA